MKKEKKAIVLFSGGLDSTTALYYALSKGFECHCLIFDYGQRHGKEIKTAVKIAKKTKSSFNIVKLALPWSSDSLTDKSKNLPKVLPPPNSVPSTYVPGRNTLFLSYALSCAESQKASEIFIGVNSVDFSNYPDCTPEFIRSYNTLLKSLKVKISVNAPLLEMSKSQIIKLGIKLKVPYFMTWSCYSGLKKPCGKCDSCRLRAKGFKDAKIKDPVL
jgi:queuosine biosynthesis protein QueC